MGYPPNQCGYCVQDLQTHQFFTSGSVIFDENIPYRAVHQITSNPANYSRLPFKPAVMENLPAHPVEPSTPPSCPLPPSTRPRRPVSPMEQPKRTRTLTEAGKAYAQQILAAKAHLVKLQEAATTTRIVGPGGIMLREDESVEGASKTREDPSTETVSDETVDTDEKGVIDNQDGSSELGALVSLDVDEYLARDTQTISESVLLSIQSSTPLIVRPWVVQMELTGQRLSQRNWR